MNDDAIDRLASRLSRGASIRRYYTDPVAFCHDCFWWQRDEKLTPYQDEALAKLVEEHRVSLRGPHGLGKTSIESLATLWFGITRDEAGADWKVPQTAGVYRQLERYLWPEIHKWAKRIRWDKVGREPFDERRELLSLNLKLRHGAAFPVASDDPSYIEGAHADALLYICDEAKSIITPTFDAIEGAFSAEGITEALALVCSTPGGPSGRFYELHKREPGTEDWYVRHVTAKECIKAGRMSKSWADQREKQWGKDSALYANRVLGEFHSAEDDSVIELAWVEEAVERWREYDEAGRPDFPDLDKVGVDVARFGRDQTVLARKHAHFMDKLIYTRGKATTDTAGRTGGVLRAHKGAIAVVDTDGVGSGVTDQLRQQGWTVEAFHAGSSTKSLDKAGELGFADLRSAAWWHLRELLEPPSDIMLPPDDLLIGDLTAPHYEIRSQSKLKVESKKEIKKRLGRSTDSADAVIQAFWAEREKRRARMVHAGRYSEVATSAEAPVDPYNDPTLARMVARRRAAREWPW